MQVESIVIKLTENLWMIVVVIFALYFTAEYFRPKSKNTPPGPWGFPILGVAPFMGRRAEKTFTKWAKNDVMGVKVGSTYTIVLSSYDAIQEAFVKHGAFFNDKPENYIFAKVLKGDGIVAPSYTPSYIVKRKFVHASLFKLGFGKAEVEDYFIEEMDNLIKTFGYGDCELTTEIKENFRSAVGNVIFKIVAGKRYESYQDPELKELLDNCDKFFHSGAPVIAASMVFPWFKSIPIIKDRARNLEQSCARICEIAAEKVQQHEKTLDENEDNVRDLIDEYLLEIKKNGFNVEYTKESFACAVRDLFLGGLELSGNTMIFCLLLLANRSGVVKKVFDREQC